jgi:hypothetical protein
MGVYRTNAYTDAVSPTQPTYVQIEDASRHGKEVENSLVLPVVKVLQGYHNAGALWDKHINKILDHLDIVYTKHERSKTTIPLSLDPTLLWPKARLIQMEKW